MDKRTGSGWKRDLMALISTKGKVTARGRHKPVSNRTQEAREESLFLSFRHLEEVGVHLRRLADFGERHVRLLVTRWVREGISPATLQNRISHLRTLAGWLGKNGMVGPSERYVEDPALVRRETVARRDHSWTALGVDTDALIAQVTAYDRHVGIQLKLCHAFYLRREEAVMFRPHRADRQNHIVVRDGTKGGRERTVLIDTVFQRSVLDEAKAMVRGINGHVGHPDKTLEQALSRFSYVARRFGISKKGLGITPHGLRHQGLNDLYERVAGVPSPVRALEAGMHAVLRADRETEDIARARVSEAGGHTRTAISGAYIGSFVSRTPMTDPAMKAFSEKWTRLFVLMGRNDLTDEEGAELKALRETLLSALTPNAPLPAAADTDATASR